MMDVQNTTIHTAAIHCHLSDCVESLFFLMRNVILDKKFLNKQILYILNFSSPTYTATYTTI